MYVEYESISKKPDVTTYVPISIADAQATAFKTIDIKIRNNWDDWVCSKLDLSIDNLWDSYSAEQIDAIGICIYNFERNKTLIIGDETGIGKGRILSGISRWAWKQNKNVLFFTEREHLLSEFWKDLTHTENLSLLKNPILFHNTSKIYDQNLQVALKGSTKQVKDIEENGFSKDTNLVLTNYSQISLEQHQKTKKTALTEYIRNSLIILDESHNATGDSNTKKFLISLLDVTPYIVFSSATYMKDESQIDLYQNHISFDLPILQLMKKTLQDDKDSILRKIFTYELTKKLEFIRREHKPLDVGWKTITCDNEVEINNYLSQYSKVINGLFEVVNFISKTEDSLETQQIAGSWFSLGATINRLSRNLLLILKTPTIVQAIKENLSKDEKAVIVIDSTLASMINKIQLTKTESTEDLSSEQQTQTSNVIINFQEALIFIIKKILEKYILQHKEQHELLNMYDDLVIKTELFAGLTLSPIDYIKQELSKNNIACGEISGRKIYVDEKGNIAPLSLPPKQKTVSDFNNGEIDVVIITRSGASGISLHASRDFKDQKVRGLYELEITNRPTYRLQFIGRVNRKNQAKQPKFYSIITKLPFEHRILNIEQNKLKKLQTHINGDSDKMSQENIVNLFNEYTDKIAFEYLKNNKKLAYQMGINLKTPKDDLYYVDSILKRCIVLSSEKQNEIYNFLIATVEIYEKLNIRKDLPDHIETHNIKTFWHKLSAEQKKQFAFDYGKFPQQSINQFKYPWVGVVECDFIYSIKGIFDKNLKAEFESNQIKNDFDDNLKTKIYSNLNYSKEFLENHVFKTLDNLNYGTQVKLKTEYGYIYGYIHDIDIPKINDIEKFSDLIILQIKTINPFLNEKITYCSEDYYITLKEIFESDKIETFNMPINFHKYSRPQKEIIKKHLCLIGHPVYLQFLHQSYQMGHLEYVKIGQKYRMCFFLPKNFNNETIMQLKKPIYDANEIMDRLIKKEIHALSTSWKPEDEEKPTLKISPTSGGYNIFIANEVIKDINVIDIPLKQKLNKKYRLTIKAGFHYYLIPYKEIRYFLHMFEKRGVIWFMN